MNLSNHGSMNRTGSVASSERSSNSSSDTEPTGGGRIGPYWDGLRKLPRVRVGVAPISELVFWGVSPVASIPHQDQNPQYPSKS